MVWSWTEPPGSKGTIRDGAWSVAIVSYPPNPIPCKCHLPGPLGSECKVATSRVVHSKGPGSHVGDSAGKMFGLHKGRATPAFL